MMNNLGNHSAVEVHASDEEPDLILEVSNLTVRSRNRIILDKVTFQVERGTSLAIVGPNGGGKTTLLRALLKVIPYDGTIRWRGEARTGYVPQNLISTDLPISVKEFLRLKSKTGLDESLSLVGLKNEILAQSLGTLSGGELQRVLIAWAIIDKPNVLLLDEPTTGVDIGAEEPIHMTVKKLKEQLGTTILLISHDMHVVMHYSDYYLALNRCVLSFGKTSDLSHEDVMKGIFGSGPTQVNLTG